jgi:hypothetical protein
MVAVAGLLAAAAPALADNQMSSNWSGYAVHGPGLHFRDVSGQWRVPAVNCNSASITYSAMWAGLGGFSKRSNALEQTGTEADCHGSRPVYSAWYEFVPALPRTLSLTVRPGDLIRAEVKVSGRRVTVTLSNLTRRSSFSRTLTPTSLDSTSAEWILEAPGQCSHSNCVTLPLADFGRAAFSHAQVMTASGVSGAISSTRWRTTRITLTAGGRHFVDAGPSSISGGASPGALSDAGRAFSLRYVVSPVRLARAAAADSRIAH